MDNELLLPALNMIFGDDNENLKAWSYTKDLGQEFFPDTAAIKDGFGSMEGAGICSPAPKLCEGRVLRWFDLGTLPDYFEGASAFLAKLNHRTLKAAYMPKKVTYLDIAIGSGNQVQLPQIPAVTGHVYYIVLIPEGEPIAILPVEMNLEDAAQLEKFQRFAASKEFLFVRGILVKASDGLLQIVPIGEGRMSNPERAKASGGDSK